MPFYSIQSGVALTPQEPELRRYLNLICDPKNQPAYACCNIGIDRTSYYVAAYRIAVEGWTVRQAVDEMYSHGLKMWWITFREFEDSLRANEAFLRQTAHEMGCERPEYKSARTPCPCSNLDEVTFKSMGLTKCKLKLKPDNNT